MRSIPLTTAACVMIGAGLSLPLDSLQAEDNTVSPAACTSTCPVPMVRKDFNTLTAVQVDSLEKGIAAMMKLDNGVANNALDPLGWQYQAYIHGTNFSVTPKPYAWNSCKHSSWYFLSWHRMELYFFERILRAMSGDATLTLPYWNFGPPPAGMDPTVYGARLPAAFRLNPGNAPMNAPWCNDTTMAIPQPGANALWWSCRNAGLNKSPGATDTSTPVSHTASSTEKAFAAPAFFTNIASNGGVSFGGGATVTPQHFDEGSAQGLIEQQPHNSMHGAVGNGTRRSMSNAVGAGLDPMFWLVHANIDRAWSCWQQTHPTDAQPNDGAWLTQEFKFYDVDMSSGKPVAKQVTYTGQQVKDTAAQLNYVYDKACKDFETPAAPSIRTEQQITQLTSAQESGEQPRTPRTLLSEPSESEFLLAADPVTVSIRIPSAEQARIENLLRDSAPTGAILLTVGSVAADQLTGAAYGIYLNLPPGPVPNDRSDYYATQIAFFGIGHHHDEHEGHMPDMGQNLTYDITDAVRRLVARGELRDSLSVTFANNAAREPDRAQPPAAPAEARARFTYLKLMVQ